MPSYVLNPLLDEVFFEDVLCKKFLSLDLQQSPKSLLSVMPIGYKKAETPCPLSLGGAGPAADSTDCADLASGRWGQQPWNRTPFWAERSVSMAEPGPGGLRWPSVGEGGQLSPTASGQSSTSSSSRYKTELCRTFAESGTCKYGGKCQFAHGAEELRDLSRHPKYKTEPCRTFHTIGYCPYGIRCHFVHNNEEDLGPGRCAGPWRPGRRPPLLRQSVSFAGFPSAPAPEPFLRAPSVSPPADGPFSAAFEPVPEPPSRPQPRAASCCRSPPCAATLRPRPQHSLLGSLALGSRSLSYTSLSDHECSGSSGSSLSGSETSVFEGAGRRLPIFSQLSVPDDAVGNAGSAFFI